MKSYFSILILLLIFACKKNNDEMVIPPDDDEPFCYFCDTTESKLEVIWHTPLHSDTLKRLSTHPIIVEDKAIFTTWPDAGENEQIIGYNIHTGNIDWQRESPYINSHTNNSESLFNYEDNFLYKAGQGVVCLFEGDTSEDIWCYHPDQDDIKANAKMSVIGNKYYREHNPAGLVDEISYLMEGDIETGAIEVFLTEEMEDNFAPELIPPREWIDEEGQVFYFIENASYNWDTNDSYPDLIMLKYETKEEVYRWKDLGVGSIANPYIWNDRLYLSSDDSLFCIDIKTKDFLWKIYPGNGTRGNFLIENDVLVLNLTSEPIMGIDPNTGAILWREEDSGATSSVMTAFEGVVYFGSIGDGKLFAVDVETGEHIWAEKSPFKDELTRFQNAYFSNGVVIDPVNRILYTDDSYYAMAIKLPER